MRPLSGKGRYWRALVLLSMMATTLNFVSPNAAADDRLSATDHPAIWQQAIVKLSVPVKRWEDGRRRHFIEDCTGSLIKGKEGILILTAWHCVEGFNDLTQVIIATASNGEIFEAQVSAIGASMSADWALLSLNRSAQTMQNTSYLELAKIRPIEGQLILMAGFSRDQQLGDNGSTLTFDPDCQVRHTPSGANAIYTNCTAFKGASGGPVLTLESDTYKVLGVISAGDEAGLSLFTPVTAIARSLW